MNFHAVMPFYRQYMHKPLLNWFQSMNLIWHPVCDIEDIRPFVGNKESWIKPVLCDPLLPGEQCYKKLNYMTEFIDDDYYGFIHDDDMYIPGFIDKIKQRAADVIYYSASRGQNWTHDTKAYNWPPDPLIINTLDDVRVANIDLCQYIIKGRIYKQMKFGYNIDCADGIFAEELKVKFSGNILVLPEIGINFNYFQDGRYNDMRWNP
jgi:hypothetical protein